jgi:hypothetical protein
MFKHAFIALSVVFIITNINCDFKAPIQVVPGILPLGVKRQRREADHSPQTSAEVKKIWIYTSTLPYAFMDCA